MPSTSSKYQMKNRLQLISFSLLRHQGAMGGSGEINKQKPAAAHTLHSTLANKQSQPDKQPMKTLRWKRTADLSLITQKSFLDF